MLLERVQRFASHDTEAAEEFKKKNLHAKSLPLKPEGWQCDARQTALVPSVTLEILLRQPADTGRLDFCVLILSRGVSQLRYHFRGVRLQRFQRHQFAHW